ncbi:MAG: response regulator, partial [Bacillota bacterium]
FVEMSGYYNQLVRKLKEYFWIKDGRSSLNEELAGNIPLSELTLKAVSFLARITDSGHGVFYIYNNEEKVLHLNASYAFTEKDQMSNKYALGEGLVGQAALERKPILLKNVKRQDALIVAGTIREAPLNIYTLPLVYEDELYGVIELSSFEPFTTLKQEFLKDASKIISVNLYSAIQSQRIRNLLKISESAQKEAKRKADELKEANEELEEQQRLLQQQTEELQQTNAQLEEQQQLLQQQSEELQQTNSQLEEQQQLLEEQSRLLNTKNQDLEISREELLKRSEELERVSKYKSEFLANMSHELRTPLNSIILLAKMLDRKMTNELSQKDREKINIIYKAGQELLRLINDILDLSKIESGKLSLNVTTFNSSELLEDLKQMFEGVSKEKNIRFVLEDDLDTKLKGDKDKISQILRNFLSNAFKFTEEGSVTLKVMPDEDREGGVVFSVIDTGIGISENKLSMIFEEFQQGDGSISRKYGGTGLGLSISRKLTDLMKGEVRLNSREGEGSTFSLYLPDLIYKQNDKADLIIKHSDADRQYSSEKSKKVIMVIEDDKDFAHYIENINSSAGFETLLAYSGREGLDMLKKHKVDGILLDLKLPDVSGVEVLRELKSTIELRKIPVHIISVCDEDNKLKKMGALGYKQKPVNEDEIKELVSRMIAFSEKSPKNLLVIEDDTIQQDAIRELIESREIKLKIVDAEEKARCELARGIYDAVVLDLELKDGNGINICRFIGEQNIQIPVIIYTGKDLSVDQEKEIRRYADSIIVKTANSEERLLDEVTLFLHKVKGNVDHGHYLFSKMKRECALSLDRKRILIVDDDPRNVFVLASALEDYGAEIIDADNGKSALEMLRKYKTDLILLDIMMPVMDGYETIRAIRNDKELRDIPIIALTAKSLKGDREKCIEAGANDYISKPVDYDVLTRLVKAWIVK